MSALNLDGYVSPRKRSPLWAIAAAAALAATLLVALAFDLLGDDRADAIHQAVAERRLFPAPELELVTAGDVGGTPRGWWRLARDGRASMRELRGRPWWSTSGRRNAGRAARLEPRPRGAKRRS